MQTIDPFVVQINVPKFFEAEIEYLKAEEDTDQWAYANGSDNFTRVNLTNPSKYSGANLSNETNEVSQILHFSQGCI